MAEETEEVRRCLPGWGSPAGHYSCIPGRSTDSGSWWPKAGARRNGNYAVVNEAKTKPNQGNAKTICDAKGHYPMMRWEVETLALNSGRLGMESTVEQGERFREETTDEERGSFLGQRGTQSQIWLSKGIGYVQIEIGEPMLFCFYWFDLFLVIDFFFFLPGLSWNAYSNNSWFPPIASSGRDGTMCTRR